MSVTMFSLLNYGDRFQHRERGQISAIFVKLKGRNARCEVGDGSNFHPEREYEFGDSVAVEILRDDMSPESLGEYANKSAPDIINCLKLMSEALMPGEIGPVEVEGKDDATLINVTKWGVCASPVVMYRPRIGGKLAHGGWEVSTSKTVSNYPHAPDDVDSVSMGQTPDSYGVAGLIVQTVFAMRLDAWLQRKTEEDWAADEAASRIAEKQYEDSK